MNGRPDERRLEEMLLRDELRYDKTDACKRAGVSKELGERMWRALGFAALADDDVAFTEGDVNALRITGEIIDMGIVDEDLAIRMGRAMGQALARLAESEIDAVTQLMFQPGKPADDDEIDALLGYINDMLPLMEPLIIQAWRRQLAASGTRLLAATVANPDAPVTSAPQGIGFADIVSFTELSRNLDQAELARLVDGFESVATGIIAAHRGRLVKTLGDEVLFAADDPVAVTEIGLDLAEAMDTPRVRVGVAYGPVLPVMGDVFGTTVNLASRLTAMARPGAVLCDGGLAEALGGRERFRTVRILRRPARGLGVIQPYVVRRVGGR